MLTETKHKILYPNEQCNNFHSNATKDHENLN